MLFVFKIILGFLVFVLGLVVLYAILAFLLPLITIHPKPEAGIKDRQFYLYGNGIHIDVIFRRQDIEEALQQSLLLNDDAEYIAFGWGDRGFYLHTPTWGELKFSTAFNAMAINSPSVMHITEHTALDKEWRIVTVNEQQFKKMLAYVQTGFQYDETGKIIHIPDTGYTPNDRFFEGDGSYHCAYTCNTWVNTGLKKAGLKVGLWATQQNGILRYYPERVGF